MKYNVYFELYGKKMKATIEAKSTQDAEYLVRGKIVFHKVVPQTDDGLNHLKDILGFK